MKILHQEVLANFVPFSSTATVNKMKEKTFSTTNFVQITSVIFRTSMKTKSCKLWVFSLPWIMTHSSSVFHFYTPEHVRNLLGWSPYSPCHAYRHCAGNGQGFPQGHQYWGLVPLWVGSHCFKVGGQVFVVEEGGIDGDSKISMYLWKLFSSLTLVGTKRLLEREYLFWLLFLTSQYFRVYQILQFYKF